MSTPLKLVAFSKEEPARLLTIYLMNQGFRVEYQHSDNEYSHSVVLLELSEQIQAKKIAEDIGALSHTAFFDLKTGDGVKKLNKK